MKKFLILLVVVVPTSIFPVVAYADEHHDRQPGHHDQSWKDHHDRQWRDHEREWKEHDLEWRAHRYDRHWREVHAREWHEWYQWHRDNNEFISTSPAIISSSTSTDSGRRKAGAG